VEERVHIRASDGFVLSLDGAALRDDLLSTRWRNNRPMALTSTVACEHDHYS